MAILVTGGAGFIGANFVLDWLAQSDERVINLDKLTYAGNLENLSSLDGDQRHMFVQDNHSRSVKGVLRGLHNQIKQPQGKLVRVVAGEVFDVAVDLRKCSPTFGQWVGELLSAEKKRQMWVPEGFAHGFLVLSESAEFLYKTTDYFAPQHERCLRWNDASVAVDWPLRSMPVLSLKDQDGQFLEQAEVFI
jgi:dTDP-4-dehydrorhamnose 3,5-epimerase